MGQFRKDSNCPTDQLFGSTEMTDQNIPNDYRLIRHKSIAVSGGQQIYVDEFGIIFVAGWAALSRLSPQVMH